MLVIFGLGVPLSTVHEIGHGLICWADGGKFTFELTAFGAIGQCIGDISDPTLFLAMGGGLGAITAGLIAIAVRRYKGIFLGMLTIMAGHLFNLVLETFAYQFYIQGFGSVIVTQLFLLAVWFGLILFYVKKETQLARLTA
jgi:ABC-type branched-subunit amino acid transport system permease subunit